MDTTPPRGTVPPTPSHDNPDADPGAPDTPVELEPFTGEMDIATALENLRHRVASVETFALAARDAMDAMPHVADERARRRVERVGVLVRATTDAALDALGFADAAVRLLRQYLGEKRSRRTVVEK
jgi:hypothetical protein